MTDELITVSRRNFEAQAEALDEARVAINGLAYLADVYSKLLNEVRKSTRYSYVRDVNGWRCPYCDQVSSMDANLHSTAHTPDCIIQRIGQALHLGTDTTRVNE